MPAEPFSTGKEVLGAEDLAKIGTRKVIADQDMTAASCRWQEHVNANVSPFRGNGDTSC
jgi:hypothetical protein